MPNREKDASIVQLHHSSFFPCVSFSFSVFLCLSSLPLPVSASLPASPSFSHSFLSLSGCTNLQRAAGWHGGSQRCQVDVSALLPSLCLPESLHNNARSEQATKRAHTCTLERCPHSSENANARMAVVVMKGNDPGRQAPSTRKGQGGQRRDKQTAYSLLVSPTPSPSVCTLSASLCLFFPPLCPCTKSRL